MEVVSTDGMSDRTVGVGFVVGLAACSGVMVVWLPM